MTKKLYSLLIGIADYPIPNSLSGCVRDIENMKEYILGINQSFYDQIEIPVELSNEKATKSNIVSSFNAIVDKLKDEDTLIFYFSGHGAEELAPGRFLEDHNGKLQCLVCYHNDREEHNHLLADKELRYLFNKSKSKAHIIAIFDCCHSGDITRGIEQDKSIKRLAVTYPERPYKEFLFSSEIEENTFKNSRFNSIFPDINLITLSACASNEFSWEKSDGGYFTKALLQSLESNNNSINYGDLTRECRILIQNNTQERQSPTIDVFGNKDYNQLTSWLRINGDKLLSSLGYIKYYESKGWIYSRGSINGVQEDNTITVNVPGFDPIDLKINEVFLSESKITDPLNIDFELDRSIKYAVILNGDQLKPKIAIENLDGDLKTEELIIDVLKNDERIVFTDQYFDCDFQINIFNELTYFSRNNDPYRPLNRQLDLIPEDFDEDNIEKRMRDYIVENLNVLSRWHQIKNLNLGEGFKETPIKVEIKHRNNEWIDITNGHIALDPEGRKSYGILYSDYEMRVSNTSKEDLYVTVLSLYNSLLEVSIHAFDETTVLLEKDCKPKNFEPSTIVLDYYQEIYNWECEAVEHRFIVNNYQSLNAEIALLAQTGFSEPITHLGVKKGDGKSEKYEKYEKRDKSAIYSSTVQLNNNTFNQISGTLLSNIEWYQENEIVQPFIEKLYFDIHSDFFNYNLANKPSSNEEAYKGGIKMNIGNFIDYTRRNRKFKKMRRQYPEKDIIVAEGDSWFLYPILVKDTIDYIMESWPVKNLAWAGDTLENYKKSGQLLKTVNKLVPHPKYVLISGGGNDIIGKEITNLLIRNATNVKSPRDYLNDKYDQQIQELRDYYIYFFDELSKLDWIEKILVHGYDYIRSDHARIVVKGGWLNRYLEDYGITVVEERERLIVFLIDEFNSALRAISEDYPKVKYMNLRGLINRDEWYDEIHPNNEGYRKVANKFLTEINQ